MLQLTSTSKEKMGRDFLSIHQCPHTLINSEVTNFYKLKINKSQASQFLVPFFLKILDLEENALTKAISDCVIKLDNLAQQIDSSIDSKKHNLGSDLGIDSFDDLSNKICDCFFSLEGMPKLDNLIKDTINCVNTSFRYNTIERHLVYSLYENDTPRGSTMFYLLPLIKYLSQYNSPYNRNTDLKNIFIFTTNYVQLVDDFIDLFDDIKFGTSTPVTEMFYDINGKQKDISNDLTPFNVLTLKIKSKLSYFSSKIIQELIRFKKKDDAIIILSDIFLFELNLTRISLPIVDSELENVIYLKKVYDILPPIVCYSG